MYHIIDCVRELSGGGSGPVLVKTESFIPLGVEAFSSPQNSNLLVLTPAYVFIIDLKVIYCLISAFDIEKIDICLCLTVTDFSFEQFG